MRKARIKHFLLCNFGFDYLVVGGPLDDLLEDGRVHVGQRDNFLILNGKVFFFKSLHCNNPEEEGLYV